MALYECVFIARQDISNTALNTTIDRFKKIIDDNKSKVHDTEIWGLRSLSYKIKKNRKGNFVMMKIEGSGVAISELERNFRIEEDIIRYLTIKVKKFNEEPSFINSDNLEFSGTFGTELILERYYKNDWQGLMTSPRTGLTSVYSLDCRHTVDSLDEILKSLRQREIE